MQYFFHPDLDNSVTQFSFDREESRHIVKVLRKKEGDILHITNGKGFVFSASITEADPKRCMAKIIDSEKKHQKMHWLHIAAAPTKSNDRFEWFLEKATEIGINEITPLICERSERRKVNTERWAKVIQSGMKQSLRAYLPILNEPISYSKFIEKPHEGFRFIAHCEPGEKADLKRKVAADKDVLILIGPEGDFTPEEIKMACDAGYMEVSLGEARLRSETAALVACTTVNIINNG